MSYGDVAEYLGQGGPRQVGRVMALWGGSAPWWRVVHADGSLVRGHERAALERYRAERTPLRPSPHGPPSRVDMRLARWAGDGRVACRQAVDPPRRRTGGYAAGLKIPRFPGAFRPPPDKSPRHPVNLTADVGALCWNAGRWTITRTPYRLLRLAYAASRSAAPGPRAAGVVSHAGGPLLVLAGPGTGKTTAIVEAVVDRISGRGIDPARVLVLTFSRKAARGTARADHPAARPDHPRAARADLPQLRLRAGAPGVRAGRRRAADPAARPGAAARGQAAAARRGRGRRRRAGRSGSGPRSAPGASPPSCATSCSARPSAAWTGAAGPARQAARPR